MPGPQSLKARWPILTCGTWHDGPTSYGSVASLIVDHLCGHPSNSRPRSTVLNFSDRTALSETAAPTARFLILTLILIEWRVYIITVITSILKAPSALLAFALGSGLF